MTEKLSGPIPPPDSKWHQPYAEYARELFARLDAIGISMREASRRIGVSLGTLRDVAKGEKDMQYTVQYALEALARNPTGDAMNKVQERPMMAEMTQRHIDAIYQEDDDRAAALSHGDRTIWWKRSDRPLGLVPSDVGKLVVGKDRFGAGIFGELVRDNFGLVIREWRPQAVDVHDVPVDRIETYTLLDPPEHAPSAEPDDEPPSRGPDGFQTHVRKMPPRK